MTASVSALAGRRDEALDQLQLAYDLGWRRHGLIEHHLAFESLRGLDRYNGLIRLMREATASMRERVWAAETDQSTRLVKTD